MFELDIAPIWPEPIASGAVVPGLMEPGMDPLVEPGIDPVVDPGIDPFVEPGIVLGLLVVPGAVVAGPAVVDWAEATVARPIEAAEIAIVFKLIIIFSL